MKRSLATLAFLATLSIPTLADEPGSKKENAKASGPAMAMLPKGVSKFNGMLIGRLAAKDVEKGTFQVDVDAVARVWRNSKAEDPKSMVGKRVEVSGVFGRFLDVLVTTRTGETLEFECKHDGDGLVFPGELLRKVAAYDPADYPEIPEEFRGFQGAVVGMVVKKDPEVFELIFKVDRVKDVWKDSKAKNPKSIQGKTLMLAGFWNRKDEYHKLKVGDRIEVGMKHIGMRSEHLTVAEFVRKADSSTNRN